MKYLLLITYALYGFNQDVIEKYLDTYMSKYNRQKDIVGKAKNSTYKINSIIERVAQMYYELAFAELGLAVKNNTQPAVVKFDLGILFYGTPEDKKHALEQLSEHMPQVIIDALNEVREEYPMQDADIVVQQQVANFFHEIIFNAITQGTYIQYDVKDKAQFIQNKAKKTIKLKNFNTNKKIMTSYQEEFLQSYQITQEQIATKNNAAMSEATTILSNKTKPVESSEILKTDVKMTDKVESANTQKTPSDIQNAKSANTAIIMQSTVQSNQNPRAKQIVIYRRPQVITPVIKKPVIIYKRQAKKEVLPAPKKIIRIIRKKQNDNQ